MAVIDGYTFMGSADFTRSIPFGLAVNTVFVGANDINYASGTAGTTSNAKFINAWNNGTFGITVSGTNTPFDDIIRFDNPYNLRATTELLVTYIIPGDQADPLPSNPPIQLSAIQSKFSANSLNGARINAGFSSPISMLNFLGQAPGTPDISESEDAPIISIFGDSWTEFTSGTAETGTGGSDIGFGNFPVSPVAFFFGTSSVPIPQNATISSVRVRVRRGAVTGDTGVLASASFWLQDFNIAGGGGPSPI